MSNNNLKAPNNTALPANIGSFITAPVNTMTNMANNMTNMANNFKNKANNVVTNAANSFKNTFNNIAPSEIAEPIKNTFNATIENTPSPLISIPVILMLGVLIVLFIVVVIFREQIANGLQYGWEKAKDIFGISKPAVQAPPPEFVNTSLEKDSIEKILPGKKEVFNVAQDKYTYSDAEPLCKAFGAELATYDQVKDAWNKGADWCNYGWVKGQAAVFPTQQTTFDKLQAGPEDQRMSCGMPGINGGYFDNPELRFGVNCYGQKPGEDDADAANIMAQNKNLTPEAIEYDKKVLNYKAEMGQIAVNPFKPGVWSS
jgi:hypothetical protein